MRRNAALRGLALLSSVLAACVSSGPGAEGAAPAARVSPAPVARTPYTVVNRYPHDPAAFVQGLVWAEDGVLWESTGQYGQSTLRRVELASGKVTKRVDLAPDAFGEGLARIGRELIQLTWTNGRAYVYDADTLARTRVMTYTGEGWGLTTDGRQLYMSDGSATLTVRDPATMREVRRIPVTLDGRPVSALNELEWVEGEVWANVWHQPVIVRIDPATGRVGSYLDLSGLIGSTMLRDKEAVLNGIAWDPQQRHVLVTGKLWPWLYALDVPRK